MTASYRLRGIGWFISSVVVVLGCYLVSLQVAAERKRVADVERAIVQARRDIRALETEFSTRANIAQLERWNGEVLALAVPTADQFVTDDAALAQVRFDSAPGTEGATRTAALVMPAAVATPLPVPAVVPPSVTAPAAPSASPPARAIMASAAVVGPRVGDSSIRGGARRLDRGRSVALLDRKALRENRLGDLMKDIPIERSGTR